MKYVLGQKPAQRRVDEELEDESEGRGSYATAERTVTKAVSSRDEDEDDALSYFQKLAES